MEVLFYYWPRFFYGLIFVIYNGCILKKYIKGKNIAVKTFILFLFSCPVVSIVNEKLSQMTFYDALLPALFSGYSTEHVNALFVVFSIVADALSFIIPILIFKRIMKIDLVYATTIYMMNVCLDRLCLVMSFSAISYFVIYTILIIVGYFVFVRNTDYSFDNPFKPSWKPVCLYVLAMFFLFDSLFGVYYIFPGIVNGEFDTKNAWVDVIAMVTMIFFIGFLRLNLLVSVEESKKLLYMNELKDSQTDIIQKFAQISEAKSGETGHHVKRVSEYSVIIASAYGIDDRRIEILRTASMMHDVGKLLIPNEIVEKPGKLSYEESLAMQMHTKYGYDILSNSIGEVINMARTIAYEHHERYDGQGYPQGISGDEISVYAQIVSVADVYDALTSERSYKPAWSPEASFTEIISQKGKQFAPEVVDAFISCYYKIEETRKLFKD